VFTHSNIDNRTITGEVHQHAEITSGQKMEEDSNNSTSLSAFSGCLGHERANLLFDASASAMRTFGLSLLILAEKHGHGKGFLALVTDVVIGRHGNPSFNASI